jgi:spore germination cell wall hydrolase CwlJ-like protein
MKYVGSKQRVAKYIPRVYKRRRRIPLNIIDRCIIASLAVTIIGMIVLIGFIVAIVVNSPQTPHKAMEQQHTEMVGQTQETPTDEKKGQSGTPTEVAVFFTLTAEQRTLIEQVVSAESRGEPYDGQVAVAQCILNACLKDGITPEQAIKKYKYTGTRVEPTASVKEAVAAVFDRGEGVTEEPIMYFYAPALVTSEWHESQIFVIEIKNHRFFKEAE